MNKVIIKTTKNGASIFINGMEMTKVYDFKLTKEFGTPARFEIGFYLDDSEIETEGE